MMKHGLNPTPHDPRDFPLGGPDGFVSLPALETLPPTFRFETLGVKDQKETDFCSAFSSDLVSEIQEGIELCPEWGFAASKALSGDATEYGQDIRIALKRHLKYGALPKAISPFTLESKDEQFLRLLENWPDLTDKAKGQEKKSFAEIKGQYDHFDNIRASIWYFKDKKQAVLMGLIWSWQLTDLVLSGMGENGFGHMIAVIGWNEQGLVLQNSAGLSAGDKGCHTITRETVNHFVEMYKAFMLVDFSPDEVKYMLDHGITLEDGKLSRLWKSVTSCL